MDGTWDSICMRCYATAAHTHREILLSPAESKHHCDEASWTFKAPARVPVLSSTPKPVQFPARRGGYIQSLMPHSGPLKPARPDRS